MAQFEKDFLLGAATAAHQVEGNNIHSDCWAQEQMKHSSYAEPSLDAVDHYHHYEEDIRLLADAGLNAYRFSVEWARIEPEEGRFDENELEHYSRVIDCCIRNSVEPVVTLHHFSSPAWLIRKGGWEAKTTPDDFSRYVRVVMEHLGSRLHYVCTINEANMGIQVAAISRRYILQMRANTAMEEKKGSVQKGDGAVQMGVNLESMMQSRRLAADENKEIFDTQEPQCFTSPRTPEGDLLVMKAHQSARAVIRELCPQVKVGLTLSLHDIQAVDGGEERAKKEWEEEFLHYLPYIAEDDFLGVQNYTRSLIGPDGQLSAPQESELTQMNYEFYPEALEHVIRCVAEDYHGELIVTENGIATADDERRIEFIRRATEGVARCRADEIPVRGYFYWSLLDNFEWQKGFSKTFGLIAVERSTQTRKPKESLSMLGKIR